MIDAACNLSLQQHVSACRERGPSGSSAEKTMSASSASRRSRPPLAPTHQPSESHGARARATSHEQQPTSSPLCASPSPPRPSVPSARSTFRHHPRRHTPTSTSSRDGQPNTRPWRRLLCSSVTTLVRLPLARSLSLSLSLERRRRRCSKRNDARRVPARSGGSGGRSSGSREGAGSLLGSAGCSLEGPEGCDERWTVSEGDGARGGPMR